MVNEIETLSDHSILYIKNSFGLFKVLIDTEDIDKIKDIHWNAEKDKRGKFYVRNRKKNLRLHRVITNCPPNLVVDHINHNTLDNRKSNLRVCTIAENNRNTNIENKYPNKTTGIYGISIWKTKGKNNKIYSYFKIQYKGKVKVFKHLKDAKRYLKSLREEYTKEKNNVR